MRIVFAIIATAFTTTVAIAGGADPIPMPGAGVAGPAALLAAIGAVVGVKYLRNRRPK